VFGIVSGGKRQLGGYEALAGLGINYYLGLRAQSRLITLDNPAAPT